MSDVTQILNAIEQGNPSAADQLLPLVYDELRLLAAQRMAGEKPGQTIQATALVHEAYIRLVDVEKAQQWESRRHFYAAAAEAMRRILVERARRKGRLKRGGGHKRKEFDSDAIVAAEMPGDLLELDAALRDLEKKDARKAEVVKLRYFAGLTIEEVAAALKMSSATVDRDWTYARAWLFRQMTDGGDR